MQGVDPLDALRDIHLPSGLPWWPLAPGWWVIIFFLLLLVSIFVFLYLRHRYEKSRFRREALQQINKLQQRYQIGESQHELLAELSQLLKTVAVTRFPEQHHIAGLKGKDWLEFLHQTQSANATIEINRNIARGLIIGPYRAVDTVAETDMSRLLVLAKEWLVANA